MIRKEQYEDFVFRALNTKQSADTLNPNDLVVSENAYLDEEGQLSNRPGILCALNNLSFTGNPKKPISGLNFHRAVDGNDYVLVGLNDTTPSLWYSPTGSSKTDFSATKITQEDAGTEEFTSADFRSTQWVYDSGSANVVTWTVLSNYADPICYFAGGASPAAKTTDLITAGTAYRARYMMIIARRLIIGDIHDGTYQLENYLAISKAGDIQDFATAASGNSGDTIPMEFKITGLSPLPQPGLDPAGLTSMGIIFGPKETYLIVDTGEEDRAIDVPFKTRLLSKQYGNVARDVLEVEGKVYFFTGSKFMFTAGTEPIDIMDDIKPTINTINKAAATGIRMGVNVEDNEICFAVPTGTSTVNNKLIRYNYRKNYVQSIDDIPAGALCSGIDDDGRPILFIGTSTDYSLVGTYPHDTRIDYFDDGNTISGDDNEYQCTATGGGSPLSVVTVAVNGQDPSFTTNEFVGLKVYNENQDAIRTITANTATTITLSSTMSVTLADKFYIGHIPFHGKSAYHRGSSRSKKKNFNEIEVRHGGTFAFTCYVELYQNGSGAVTNQGTITQVDGTISFPTAFPWFFAIPLTSSRISMRNLVSDTSHSMQIGFKNYRSGERPAINGYTLKYQERSIY